MKINLLRLLTSTILLALAFGLHARTYLVSVGVADYSGFPGKINNLRLTTADARTIASLYADNTPVDYTLLLNEKATKSRIVKAMKKVYSKAGKDDIIVFFFSGHGYPGGFCAYDGNITYKAVREAMAESKCRNKMMFVDACRAGGMRVESSTAESETNGAKSSNVMLFLSSRNNENSIERPTMTNGLFTTFLQRGLKGAADANKDKTITAKEIFDFVHTGVTADSKEMQHPVMWGNFDTNMPVMKW